MRGFAILVYNRITLFFNDSFISFPSARYPHYSFLFLQRIWILFLEDFYSLLRINKKLSSLLYSYLEIRVLQVFIINFTSFQKYETKPAYHHLLLDFGCHQKLLNWTCWLCRDAIKVWMKFLLIKSSTILYCIP